MRVRWEPSITSCPASRLSRLAFASRLSPPWESWPNTVRGHAPSRHAQGEGTPGRQGARCPAPGARCQAVPRMKGEGVPSRRGESVPPQTEC